MPTINGTITDDGTTKTTSFTGNATNKNQTFFFSEKQNGMIFTNDGLTEVTVNANSRTYMIKSGESVGFEFELSSFNVMKKGTGSQSFSLISYLFHGETGSIPNIPNKPDWIVEDNLISTNTKNALSANQGRVLKGLVDANTANIATNTVSLSDISQLTRNFPIQTPEVDDTARLQRAINAAVGGKLVISNTTYTISSTITLPSNIEIEGRGYAEIYLANNSNSIMFQADTKSNITIRGLTFTGNRTNQNAPLETQHAIKLLNSTNVLIENNILRDCCGDGIALSGYVDGSTSASTVNKEITIRNNQIFNNGRNGISCIHVDGAVISNNKVYNQQAWVSTLGAGIDIEPNPGSVGADQWICRNISVTKNKFYNNNVGINLYVPNTGSNQNHIFENVHIEGNKIFKNNHRTSPGNSQGIFCGNIGYSATSIYNDILISNNQIYENGFDGTNVITGSHGILILSCDDSIFVSENQVRKSHFAIEISASKKQKIVNNRISAFGNTTDGVGILLRTTESSQIELNTIANPAFSNAGVYGIGIVAVDGTQISKNNNISFNTIYDSRATSWMVYGIKLLSNVAGEIITANTIQMNFFRNMSNAQPFNVTNIGTNNILLHVHDNALKVFRASQLINYNYEVSIASASRPTLNMQTGFRFFDTTLNKPIWRNTVNTGWVDGAGMTITAQTGINVSVGSGATTLSVTGLSEPDTNYKVLVTPAWNTTYWVTGKTATGFTINFGTAPSSTSTLDWFLSR